jgi:hypothetical protein
VNTIRMCMLSCTNAPTSNPHARRAKVITFSQAANSGQHFAFSRSPSVSRFSRQGAPPPYSTVEYTGMHGSQARPNSSMTEERGLPIVLACHVARLARVTDCYDHRIPLSGRCRRVPGNGGIPGGASVTAIPAVHDVPFVADSAIPDSGPTSGCRLRGGCSGSSSSWWLGCTTASRSSSAR